MSDEIQQLEQDIQTAKKIVERGNALDRLMNNRDFKKVFVEGLFEQEAIRLVHLKADPNMQRVESQQAILNQIDGIGFVKQYLSTVSQLASLASKSVASSEEMLEEMLKEDV